MGMSCNDVSELEWISSVEWENGLHCFRYSISSLAFTMGRRLAASMPSPTVGSHSLNNGIASSKWVASAITSPSCISTSFGNGFTTRTLTTLGKSSWTRLAATISLFLSQKFGSGSIRTSSCRKVLLTVAFFSSDCTMASTSISEWPSMVHLNAHITFKGTAAFTWIQGIENPFQLSIFSLRKKSKGPSSKPSKMSAPNRHSSCRFATDTSLLIFNSPMFIATFTFPRISIELPVGPMKCGRFSLSILGRFSSGISFKIAVDRIVALAPVSTVYVRSTPSICPFTYIPDTRGIPLLTTLKSPLGPFIWLFTFTSLSAVVVLAGLGYSYSVLVLAVLEYWIYGTHTVLVLMSSKVIVLILVLVLVDKYSGTCTSTDILWYICDVKVNTIIPLKQTVWLTIKEKFQLDLICYNLNISYMGCDYKFHTFFQFYHHWKINWITIFMFMFINVIRPSPVSHSTSG